MARVRSGDQEAFGWIYDRYAGSLLAFCQHMLGGREDAEDALQHVFVAAHNQMCTGAPPQQLKPWLYAVARNRCLSVLRARRETVDLGDVLEPPAGADVPRAAEQREDIREVLADVAALPHEQREALVLAEVGAMSHDEIAVILGVRKDKVKALVFQARQSLMVSREARETSCRDIQEQLAVLHGGALRRGAIRRHVEHCPACAAFKAEVQRQRALLAAALPVLPAAGLKSTVLAAATGATGTGAAAAGGISAVAATAGSSGAVGGGVAGLGSSAMVTKVLAVGAVAGIAVGGGTAVVRSQGTRDPAATPPPATRATSKAPANLKATKISARSLTPVPSGQPAPRHGGEHAPASGRSGTQRRAAGPLEPRLDEGQPVRAPERTADVIGTGSSPASMVPETEPGPAAPATVGHAQSGSTPAASDSAKPESHPAASDSTDPGSSPAEIMSAKREAQPAASSNSAKPDTPPGQANKPDTPPGQVNKPDTPPGQANKPETPPGQANKPDTPPGQVNDNKPDTPPGQATKPDTPPGQANKPDTPPGQADNATPEP